MKPEKLRPSSKVSPDISRSPSKPGVSKFDSEPANELTKSATEKKTPDRETSSPGLDVSGNFSGVEEQGSRKTSISSRGASRKSSESEQSATSNKSSRSSLDVGTKCSGIEQDPSFMKMKPGSEKPRKSSKSDRRTRSRKSTKAGSETSKKLRGPSKTAEKAPKETSSPVAPPDDAFCEPNAANRLPLAASGTTKTRKGTGRNATARRSKTHGRNVPNSAGKKNYEEGSRVSRKSSETQDSACLSGAHSDIGQQPARADDFTSAKSAEPPLRTYAEKSKGLPKRNSISTLTFSVVTKTGHSPSSASSGKQVPPELATAVMSPPDKDLMPTIYDTMQPGPDHFEDEIARSTFAPLVEGMSPALEDLPEVHVTIPIREQPPSPVSVPPSECSSRAPTPVITKTCTPVITKTRTRALSNFKLDEVKNPSSGATVLATLVDSGGKPRHWVRGVCLVSGVLIVASVVWFLARLRATPTDTNLGICRTPGCKRHARLLLAPLNHSVDPCDDFSAFACSAWKPVAERSPSEEYETSTAQLATKRWFEGFQSALTTGSKVLPVGANALRMYQACTASAKSSTPSRIHDLRELMRSLGIPWPERPKSGSPLGVLLQLALKWKVALWFRVRLLRTFRLSATEERRVVELSTQRYLLFDIKHHRHIMKSNSYASYWRSYHKVFTAGDRDVEAVSQDEINNSSDIQTDILEEWLPVIINPLPKPALLSVAELSKMASGVPETSEWTSQLTANLPEPAYGAEDRVLLRDVAILEALGAVLQRYNETDVLDHLGWHFAQCYGPVADASLLRARYGDEYAASLQSPIFCAVEVENVYEAVVTAMYAASRFDAASRETLSADLHGVVDAAKEIISAGSSWLDEGTRALVMRKLDGGGLALWPDDLLLKEVPGVSAYTWFPENTTSFWDLWIELRHKFSQISRDPEDKAVEALANHALPHFDYDYLGNRVLIAVAGLQEPFYYVDGTRSMFYGGVGFSFALQLVRSLDEVGRLVRPDPRNGSSSDQLPELSGSWFSEASRSALATSVSGCFAVDAAAMRTSPLEMTTPGLEKGITSGHAIRSSPFPEVPALEVAYAALMSSLKATGKDASHVPVLEGFSEQQVFFLTLCFLMCTRPGTANPFYGDCNKAVANFAPFTKAFNCRRGTRMNMHNYCPVFT